MNRREQQFETGDRARGPQAENIGGETARIVERDQLTIMKSLYEFLSKRRPVVDEPNELGVENRGSKKEGGRGKQKWR